MLTGIFPYEICSQPLSCMGADVGKVPFKNNGDEAVGIDFF
jgi:hypothetical protein